MPLFTPPNPLGDYKRDLKGCLAIFIADFEKSHKGDLHGVPMEDIVLYCAAKAWIEKNTR